MRTVGQKFAERGFRLAEILIACFGIAGSERGRDVGLSLLQRNRTNQIRVDSRLLVETIQVGDGRIKELRRP